MDSKSNTIFNKVKNYFLAFCIISCYPLYSIGQIWLFINDQKSDDFYFKIKNYTSDWVNAHLLLLISIVLMIPAFLAVSNYLNQHKTTIWSKLSVLFISLSVFVLFGQFTIDLCLVEIFKLPEKQAYTILDQIQNNKIIDALFYDNSKLFILFKFLDFALLAQLTIGIALVKSKKMPKWALIVFFSALMLTFFGILFDPFYGRIIKRVSYALFSFSFLPIAIALIKNRNSI